MEPRFRIIGLSFLIIGIIAFITILSCPPPPGGFQKGKSRIAEIQIKEFDEGLQRFRYDIGRYPTTAEGLNALLHNPGLASWRGPYIVGREKPGIPSDPWGRPFIYACPGEHEAYDLLSYGRDGVPGGEGEDTDIKTAAPR